MTYTPGTLPDRQSRIALDAQDQGQRGSPLALMGSRRSIAPSGDVLTGGWTTNTGATTNLYQAIDESTPSDADYVQSSLQPAGDVLEFAIPTTAPVAGLQLLRYRYSKSSLGPTDSLLVELLQGTTVVQSWLHANVPADWTGADQTITAPVTDYTILNVRFTATAA